MLVRWKMQSLHLRDPGQYLDPPLPLKFSESSWTLAAVKSSYSYQYSSHSSAEMRSSESTSLSPYLPFYADCAWFSIKRHSIL